MKKMLPHVKRIWAYDVETIINCFTVTFVDVQDETNSRSFVVGDIFDDRLGLTTFLRDQVLGLVSFNGIRFDRIILSYVARLLSPTGEQCAKEAYEIAQNIISGNPFKTAASMYLSPIPEADLFLIYHFNNEARATSLKWIQCHLNMENIQEMPHPHDVPVTDKMELASILQYNFNDVIATLRLYNHPKTKALINLRKWAKKKYGIPTINISNSHMGEMIFTRAMGEFPPPDTHTRTIHIKDVILPIIKFKEKQFNKVLYHFNRITFKSDEERPKVGKPIIFRGMKYVFGLGGLHAVRENSYYDVPMLSIDVKSFYTNVSIGFGLRPKHLGSIFNTTNLNLYNERVATTDETASLGLKESLNSVFGKSNSINSPLYDPHFTFATTVNGQMLMAMLAEEIEISEAGQVIMVNTDGMEILIKNHFRVREIIDLWSEMTKMTVVFNWYEKLMIRDVNNYIGITRDNKIKTKGMYEVEKDWHKDPSAKVLAKTVLKWFAYGSSLTATIKSSPIEDFFMFKRAKTGKFMAYNVDGSVKIKVPKTIRYVATKVGWILYQETDSKLSKVHADCYITILNDLDTTEVLDIDYDWYILQATSMVVTKTTTLFT